jgi:hypothetical protein
MLDMLSRLINEFCMLDVVEVESTVGGVDCLCSFFFFGVTSPLSFRASDDKLRDGSFDFERDLFQ